MNKPCYSLSNGLILLNLALSVVRASDEVYMTEEAVRRKFEDAGIVPHMIPVAPKHPMEILYKNTSVQFGNKFTFGDFDTQPTNTQWPTLENRLYTIIFTDPDCPRRSLPIEKEWQHWVVVNIPGRDYLGGDVLTAYIGGLQHYLEYLHRYVFLVYLQPDEKPTTFDEPRLDHRPNELERWHFSTIEFAKKYNLGNPVAGNFFMAGGSDTTDVMP